MTAVSFAILWGYVLLAATFDCLFAFWHEESFREWELNPLARFLAEQAGLWLLVVFKGLGLLFAFVLSLWCRAPQPGLADLLTATAAVTYTALLVYFFLAWRGLL